MTPSCAGGTGRSVRFHDVAPPIADMCGVHRHRRDRKARSDSPRPSRRTRPGHPHGDRTPRRHRRRRAVALPRAASTPVPPLPWTDRRKCESATSSFSSPQRSSARPSAFWYVYVDDADNADRRALDAAATSANRAPRHALTGIAGRQCAIRSEAWYRLAHLRPALSRSGIGPILRLAGRSPYHPAVRSLEPLDLISSVDMAGFVATGIVRLDAVVPDELNRRALAQLDAGLSPFPVRDTSRRRARRDL